MTAAARIVLPDWPRLMSVDLAAQYVGISATWLRGNGPTPKRIGKRVLYDIRDLDRWVDALDGQPLDESQKKDEGGDMLARVRKRLANGQD